MSEENKSENDAATVVGAIAEQNLKDDAASNSNPNFILKFIQIIFSSIITGIFEKPPFALETTIPIAIFKNKYFKTFSISLIYLALIMSLITVFKPKNNHAMFYIYAICFWITVLILSFWIISPYDENSVEYMLRDTVIKKVEKTVEELQEEQAKKLKEEEANKLKEVSNAEPAIESATTTASASASSFPTAIDQYGNPLISPTGETILNGPDGLFLIKSIENNSLIVVNKNGSPVVNKEGKQILFDELSKKFTNSDKQPINDLSIIKSLANPEILKSADNVSYVIKDGVKYVVNDKGEVALGENGQPLQLDQVDSSGKKIKKSNTGIASKYPDTLPGKDQQDVEKFLTK